MRAARGRLAAAALVVVGIATTLASIAIHGPLRVTPPVANVPVSAGSRDPGTIDANNSPTLAQNPRRPDELAVVNRIDTPAYGCSLDVSRDGGASWTHVPVPIPPGEERKCYAPDATFAADGTLYVAYATLGGNGNQPHATWVLRSEDGGRTLSAPVRVSGPLGFDIRIAADMNRPQRLYVTWLQPEKVGFFLFGDTGNRVEVARSDDGGRTWGAAVAASAPERRRPLAPVPAVGPTGVLYLLYLDVGDDRLDYQGAHAGFGGPPYGGRFTLVLGRSEDAGASWGESVVDAGVVPTRRFLAFLPPFPSLAVDQHDGRLFVAFEDGRLSPSDVYLWSLAPGTSRWSAPVRVNDTPARDGTSQYLPQIALAPDGRLDVAYLDRRRDPTDLHNSVSLQSSFDAGQTFTGHVTLTDRTSDARIGAGSERNLPDLGSRIGLVADADASLAAWTDTRAGTVGSNKQDIAFAAAVVGRGPSSVRDAMRDGGVVVALVGLVLLVVYDRRRAA